MKETPPGQVTLQLEEAKQLLEQGQVREALVLAMDALWRQLEHLRGELGALTQNLPQDRTLEVGVSRARFRWPESPSRLLH